MNALKILEQVTNEKLAILDRIQQQHGARIGVLETKALDPRFADIGKAVVNFNREAREIQNLKRKIDCLEEIPKQIL
jgi:hypothetical protein